MELDQRPAIAGWLVTPNDGDTKLLAGIGGSSLTLATMTSKSASFLSFVGMLMVTILVAVKSCDMVVGVFRGIVSMMELVPCFVYLFAGIALTMFFWVHSRRED